jgi:uncharacterized membrane protein YgdD (TMEM256/DUF423 family)
LYSVTFRHVNRNLAGSSADWAATKENQDADVDRLFFALGSVSAGLTVALGAFGAHFLKGRLTADMLNSFETGVRYQMYHSLALLAVAWAVNRWSAGRLPVVAGWFFVAGILLFSMSLYLLSLSGVRWLGAITPLGGFCFVAGWLCLVLAAWRGY